MSTKRKLDQDLIRQLANLLTENNLTEIEIEQDEVRVRVARSRDGEVYVPVPAVAAPAAGRQVQPPSLRTRRSTPAR